MELSDLLIEVDGWTRFSDHFVHVAGADTLRPTLLPHLYANILAHACNFGLEQMVQVTDIAYDQLAWYTTWYMREDTIKAAVTNLVNYHYSLPLSHRWGSGMLCPPTASAFQCPARIAMPACFRRLWATGWALPFIVGVRINSCSTAPNSSQSQFATRLMSLMKSVTTKPSCPFENIRRTRQGQRRLSLLCSICLAIGLRHDCAILVADASTLQVPSTCRTILDFNLISVAVSIGNGSWTGGTRCCA